MTKIDLVRLTTITICTTSTTELCNKYTWGYSLLSENSNGLIIGYKLACFVGLTCTHMKCTGHELVKKMVYVLANFPKMVERNNTSFPGIQVRLTRSSNQQTDQKSIDSTARYFNIKVP